MVSYATMHCGKQGCRRGETVTLLLHVVLHCKRVLVGTGWAISSGGFVGGGGLEGQKPSPPPPPPPQTCSATPPGIMLGRYKISLMSSYLELGHTCATCKAR